MKTASVRDLRTQFPRIRRLIEQEGEVVVTERGRPVLLLRSYVAPKPPPSIDYYERLRRRASKLITSSARRKLDEADRGER